MMQRDAVRLTVELVPAEFQPIEAFMDGIERNLSVPLKVGVVDAQNYCAAMVASIEPIEDEGSRAADVKVTGGRRRKTHACHTKMPEPKWYPTRDPP